MITKQLMEVIVSLNKLDGKLEYVLNQYLIKELKRCIAMLVNIKNRIEEKTEIERILETTQLENDMIKRKLQQKGVDISNLSPHIIQFLNGLNDDSLTDIRDIISEIDEEF